jgi:hypothetical protein
LPSRYCETLVFSTHLSKSTENSNFNHFIRRVIHTKLQVLIERTYCQGGPLSPYLSLFIADTLSTILRVIHIKLEVLNSFYCPDALF